MQSALAPAGAEARMVADLFTVMSAGAVIVWLAVIAFMLYATKKRTQPHSVGIARRIILVGGVVVPVIVLTALLLHGLSLMPKLRPALAADALRIEVSGEQWWWRVRYRLPDGETVTLANEIHLPVGESVEFVLTSPDVVHSFWIPALAGKVDMTPGRTTSLIVTPHRTGIYRGACAEYCGASHARMNFLAVVTEPAAFEAWLDAQSRDARAVTDALAVRGEKAFLVNGCGACHAVRGTAADGAVGPDLTHVGSRLSLAAGTLPNDADAFRHWIARTQAIKPDVHMPPFAMLPDDDLRAIGAYLEALQ